MHITTVYVVFDVKIIISPKINICYTRYFSNFYFKEDLYSANK